jgi:hypothetical protein
MTGRIIDKDVMQEAHADSMHYAPRRKHCCNDTIWSSVA